ncbi:MAG: type II toxin-antitoxin system RelE/ParE family toxin [Prosthecobacter sp.]
MKQLRVLPEVWDDLDEAVAWYDQQGGKEVGDKMAAAFDAQLEPIAAQAGTHRLIYKQFSRVLAKPFPYAIYFRIQDDWVVVTLLWHTAKNPEDLRSTLSERDPGNQ